jgi:YVTN family beta-propeller protein
MESKGSSPGLFTQRGRTLSTLPSTPVSTNPKAASSWNVSETLDMCDGRLSSGFTVPAECGNGSRIGQQPSDVVFDSGKDELFVTTSCFGTHISQSVDVVSVVTNRMIDSVTVGQCPYWAVYDSGKGEIFVANVDSGNVSVINDTTDKVVASIPVGGTNNGGPDGMAYDNGTGEVFVSNDGTGNVSVINDTSNKVVATITGGGGAGVAYDSRMGEMYVVVAYAINVISDLTDSIVTTIHLQSGMGYEPSFITYDSKRGEMFVSAYTNLYVISDATNGLEATLTCTWAPNCSWTSSAYDSSRGEVFAGFFNDTEGAVALINDSTDQLVKTLPSGEDTPSVGAYDQGAGEIFVTDSRAGNVSVVNDSTDEPVVTIPMVLSPIALSYDSGRGEIFVLSNVPDNSPCTSTYLNVFTESTEQLVAIIDIGTSFPAQGYPQIAYDSGKGEVFVPFTPCLIGIGGTNAGNAVEYVEVISDSTYRVIASIRMGTDTETGGLTYDGRLGEVFATNSQLGNVSVINDTTDQVQAIVPVMSRSSGAPYGEAFDSGTGQVFVANFGAGNVSVISDTIDRVVTSTSVYPANTTMPMVGPTSLAYDQENGEVIVNICDDFYVCIINDTTDKVVASILVANLAGPLTQGIAYDPISGQIFAIFYDNITIISDVTDQVTEVIPVPKNFVLAEFGPYGVAFDGRTGQMLVGDAPQGTVSILSSSSSPPAPVITSFSANPTVVPVGQTTVLSVVAGGGTGALRYSYTGLPLGCSSSDTWSLPCTPGVSGYYGITVYVNDTAGHSATATTHLSVSPAEPVLSSVSISPTSDTLPVDGWTTFTALTSCTGGANCPSGATYSWSLTNQLAAPNSTVGNPIALLAGSSAGTVELFVNATLNGVTREATATVTISSSPVPTLAAVSVNPPTSQITVGANQRFTAVSSCNDGACLSGTQYYWTLSNELGKLNSSAAESVTFTAGAKTGTVALTVEATLNGKTAWANATITIQAKATSGFLGLLGSEGYILIGVVVAAVAAVAGIMLMRKRAPSKPASSSKKEPEEEKHEGKDEASPEKKD